LYVMVQTNRFDDDMYKSSRFITLSYPTSDLAEIAGYCRKMLNQLYVNGLEYKRAGVIFQDLIKEENAVRDFFDPVDREKQSRLSDALDSIAGKYGREAVKIAIQGEGYQPNIKQTYLSKRYTTNLKEIIEIRV
ncbi:MAG: DUF4113 domain-containing protein, partial [Massilibacteroides sp.]|nr:DUF4113 domain-containing protein [Massilibacteroides sp.]